MTNKIYAVTMTVNERVHQLRTRSESVTKKGQHNEYQ